MFDVVGVLVLVILTLLFGFLVVRAWRAHNPALKWGGAFLASVPTLVFGLATTLALVGFAKINQTHPNPVPDFTVASTEERIARGRTIARTCAGCHSATGDLPLTGSNFAEGGPPIGQLYAPNLTPVHLAEWSDGEIIRAVREGVHRSGRSLIIMPAGIFRNLSDEDLQAVVAYLRSSEPVEPDTPPTSISVVGAILVSLFPLQTAQPPVTEPVVAPPPGPTAEYGSYLISISGCYDCHGHNLTGGTEAFAPVGPNIAVIPDRWSEQEFVDAMRTGVRPDGVPFGPDMPWRDFELYSDDDFRAMYAYLQARR